MAKSTARGRENIRNRGNWYQVRVRVGIDPVTGPELRLVESATDEAAAKRLLSRLLAKVDDEQHARSRATLGAVPDS